MSSENFIKIVAYKCKLCKGKEHRLGKDDLFWEHYGANFPSPSENLREGIEAILIGSPDNDSPEKLSIQILFHLKSQMKQTVIGEERSVPNGTKIYFLFEDELQ